MPDRTDPTKAFTLVFAGDIRLFKMNPLTTETPWGVPYAVSVGDVLEEAGELRRRIDELNEDVHVERVNRPTDD